MALVVVGGSESSTSNSIFLFTLFCRAYPTMNSMFNRKNNEDTILLLRFPLPLVRYHLYVMGIIKKLLPKVFGCKKQVLQRADLPAYVTRSLQVNFNFILLHKIASGSLGTNRISFRESYFGPRIPFIATGWMNPLMPMNRISHRKYFCHSFETCLGGNFRWYSKSIEATSCWVYLFAMNRMAALQCRE